MKKQIKLFFAFSLTLVINLAFVLAAADFQIDSFTCNPSEVVVGNVFSCTVQITNSGDNATLNTATLFRSGTWLEQESYVQAHGSVIPTGQSASITFTGLKAVSAGYENNKFAKIMLDNVEKTSNIADKKVNAINVAVVVSNSASSAAMGASITSTATVTAGGSINVILTYTRTGGTCSIGNQNSSKIINGLNDKDTQQHIWTITQGTSGNCAFTISAAATGIGGIASKIDSSSKTITCSNCPSGGDGSTTSGGGGGGAGGAGIKTYLLGEVGASYLIELSDKEKVSLNFSGKEHFLTLVNHTETKATIVIESEKQWFNLTVGDEIKVDLNKDNTEDISIKLKSINIITKKVSLIITKISEYGGIAGGENVGEAGGKETGEQGGEAGGTGGISGIIKNKTILYILIVLCIIVAMVSLYYYIKTRNQGKGKDSTMMVKSSFIDMLKEKVQGKGYKGKWRRT